MLEAEGTDSKGRDLGHLEKKRRPVQTCRWEPTVVGSGVSSNVTVMWP